MAVVDVADTFTRPDSSVLGVTPTGGKPWVRIAGSAGVSGGRASLVGGLAYVDAEVQDFDVRADLTSGAFVAFRVQDAANYWRVRYSAVQVETSRDPIYGTEYEWRADYGGVQTGGHHSASGDPHNFSTFRLVWGGGTDPTPATTLSTSHSHGGASAVHSLTKLQAYRTSTPPRQTIVGYSTTTRTDRYVYVERVQAGAVTVLDTDLMPSTTTSVRVGVVSRRDGRVAVQVNGSQVYAVNSATFLSATRAGIGSVGSGAAYADTFTLTPLNRPPEQPTGLVPNGGGSVSTAEPAVFSWTHNDPDPQSRYVMRFRPAGATAWSTVDALSAEQSRSLPVGALAAGPWEWEVETYDSTGLKSPVSARATFTAATPPGLPTITSPAQDATVGVSQLKVTWTAAEPFSHYQVRTALASNPSVVLYDSGIRAGTVSEHLTPFPVDDRTELLQVRTFGTSSGLWSGYASRQVVVDYAPPAAPDHEIDPSGPWLRVVIRNGPPGPNQPAVVSNDLYRRVAGSGDPDGERVARDLPYDAVWLDPHVGHRADVEYSVVAIGSNGASRRGPWVPLAALPVTPDDATSDVWGSGADSWDTGTTDWTEASTFAAGVYGPTYGPTY